MKLIDKTFGLVSRINTGTVMVAGWGIIAIMAITSYSVFMRYAFNRPDVWSYPLSAYLLCFVLFLATAHTLQHNIHVRVDFLLMILPHKAAIFLSVVADILSALFLTLFAWQLFRLFSTSLERGRVDETTLGWPLAAIQWVLPAGAVMMLITHLLLIVVRISKGEYGKADIVIH